MNQEIEELKKKIDTILEEHFPDGMDSNKYHPGYYNAKVELVSLFQSFYLDLTMSLYKQYSEETDDDSWRIPKFIEWIEKEENLC